MGGPQGREKSFPFLFFSLLCKLAVRNTLLSVGRMSLLLLIAPFSEFTNLSFTIY